MARGKTHTIGNHRRTWEANGTDTAMHLNVSRGVLGEISRAHISPGLPRGVAVSLYSSHTVEHGPWQSWSGNCSRDAKLRSSFGLDNWSWRRHNPDGSAMDDVSIQAASEDYSDMAGYGITYIVARHLIAPDLNEHLASRALPRISQANCAYWATLERTLLDRRS
jgi:hypothetical protein